MWIFFCTLELNMQQVFHSLYHSSSQITLRSLWLWCHCRKPGSGWCFGPWTATVQVRMVVPKLGSACPTAWESSTHTPTAAGQLQGKYPETAFYGIPATQTHFTKLHCSNWEKKTLLICTLTEIVKKKKAKLHSTAILLHSVSGFNLAPVWAFLCIIIIITFESQSVWFSEKKLFKT